MKQKKITRLIATSIILAVMTSFLSFGSIRAATLTGIIQEGVSTTITDPMDKIYYFSAPSDGMYTVEIEDLSYEAGKVFNTENDYIYMYSTKGSGNTNWVNGNELWLTSAHYMKGFKKNVYFFSNGENVLWFKCDFTNVKLSIKKSPDIHDDNNGEACTVTLGEKVTDYMESNDVDVYSFTPKKTAYYKIKPYDVSNISTDTYNVFIDNANSISCSIFVDKSGFGQPQYVNPENNQYTGYCRLIEGETYNFYVIRFRDIIPTNLSNYISELQKDLASKYKYTFSVEQAYEINGTMQYDSKDSDGINTTFPLNRFKVNLLDNSGNNVGTTITDANGNYNINPVLADKGEVRLEVKAENEYIGVYEDEGKADKDVSKYESEKYDLETKAVDKVVSVGTLKATDGEIFNIIDAVRQGANYWESNTGGLTPPKTRAIWKKGVSSGTYMKLSTGNLFIDKDSGHIDSSILHEYGHYLMLKFSKIPEAIKYMSSTLHWVERISTSYLAYTEGWAHYFGQSVLGNPIRNLRDPIFNIETLGVSVPGGTLSPITANKENELSNAGIMWDIADSSNESYGTDFKDSGDNILKDELAWDFSKVAQMMLDNKNESNPTLETMWNHWYDEETSKDNKYAMWEIYKRHGFQLDRTLPTLDKVLTNNPLYPEITGYGPIDITGDTEFTIQASDDIRITKATASINGNDFTDTSAPFTFPVNVSDYKSGKYIINFNAYDEAGNTHSVGRIIYLNIKNGTGTTPPADVSTTSLNSSLSQKGYNPVNSNVTTASNNGESSPIAFSVKKGFEYGVEALSYQGIYDIKVFDPSGNLFASLEQANLGRGVQIKNGQEGTWTLKIAARAADNTTKVAYSIGEKPSSATIGTTPEITNKANQTITGTAVAGTNIKLTVTDPYGNTTDYTTTCSTGTYSISNVLLSEGVNNISVVATKDLGVSEPVTTSIILDSSLPDYTLTLNTSSKYSQTSNGFSVSNADVGICVALTETAKVYLNNEELSNPPGESKIFEINKTMVNGDNNFTLKIVFASGYSTTKDFIITFTDTRTPEEKFRDEAMAAIKKKEAQYTYLGSMSAPLTVNMYPSDFKYVLAKYDGFAVLYLAEQKEAFMMSEAIANQYLSDDLARGYMGKFLGDETYSFDTRRKVVQLENGSIFGDYKDNSIYTVYGNIYKKWNELGREKSNLGYPISAEEYSADEQARVMKFEGGNIYYTPYRGKDRQFNTFVSVSPAVRDLYIQKKAAEVSGLGQKIGDTVHSKYYATATYTNGVISFTDNLMKAFYLTQDMDTKWKDIMTTKGYILGYPIGDVTGQDAYGWRKCEFEIGALYQHNTEGFKLIRSVVINGLNVKLDGVYEKYKEMGGEKSTLGYPTSDMLTVDYCNFENGRIEWDFFNGATVISGVTSLITDTINTITSGQSIYDTIYVAGRIADTTSVNKLQTITDNSIATENAYDNATGLFGGTIDANNLSYGEHNVSLEAIKTDGSSRTITSVNTFGLPSMLNIDSVAYKVIQNPSNFVTDGVNEGISDEKYQVIKGWAIDKAGVDTIDIYVDGKYTGSADYGIDRPDVSSVYPNYGISKVGFEAKIKTNLLSAGNHTVKLVLKPKTGYHMNEISKTQVITIDKEAPCGTGVKATVPTTENPVFKVYASGVSDKGTSGLSSVTCVVITGKGKVSRLDAVNFSGKDWVCEVDTSKIPSNSGGYTIWVYARDNDGNVGCIGGTTVVKNAKATTADVNIALNKTATASAYIGDESPDKAFNGTSEELSDKWCTGYEKGDSSWLKVDLGEAFVINNWKVIHEKSRTDGDQRMFAQEYKLQASVNGVDNWVDIDIVKNNTSGMTQRSVFPFTARYVRLFVNKSDFDGAARIYEFQLYNESITKERNKNLAFGKTVSASYEEWGNETPDKAVNGTWSDISDKWCTGRDRGNGSWLLVDLGSETMIDRWKVIHEKGVQHISDYYCYYTQNFRLQSSNDGIHFKDVDIVENNTDGVTDRLVAPFCARYVRLYIDIADADNCARIYEFQLLYDTLNDPPVPTATPTNTPTATPTATPTSALKLKINSMNEDLSTITNLIKPNIELVNGENTDIRLADIKIRYYFSDETKQAPIADCYYSAAGASKTIITFTKINNEVNPGYYMEIGFAEDAGVIKAGAKMLFKYGLHNGLWTNYTQSNDLSFKPASTVITENKNINIYYLNKLVWGNI